VRLLLGLFCLYTFVWQGSISFLPLFLRSEAGFSPTGATVVYTSVFVVGLLVSPLAGGLGDRFGHRRVGAFAPLLGALGLSATILASADPVVRVGLLAFAVGLVGFWPVMTASLLESLSRERLGGDYGFSRAVFYRRRKPRTRLYGRRRPASLVRDGLRRAGRLLPPERRRDPRAGAVRVTGGSKRC
jgi:MFS family permease